jgi:hypothetical protein
MRRERVSATCGTKGRTGSTTPCNLAVSITKAAFDNEALASLLDTPTIGAVIAAVVEDSTTLSASGAPYVGTTRVTMTVGVGRWDEYDISVATGGKLDVRVEGSDRARARDIADTITAALASVGQAVLSRAIVAQLEALGGKNATAQAVSAEDNGQVFQATLLTVTI